MLQVLVPERAGEKPQLPSHASLKGNAKKYTLDACLDGTVSQVRLAGAFSAHTEAPCACNPHTTLVQPKSAAYTTVDWLCRKMWRQSVMWRTWLTGHCKALL